jgi:hypothetical protein
VRELRAPVETAVRTGLRVSTLTLDLGNVVRFGTGMQHHSS